LKKVGPSFDLPITPAMIAANGTKVLPVDRDCCIVGELGLDGRCARSKACIPSRWNAKRHGHIRLLVLDENAPEAAVVDGLRVFPNGNLREAWALLTDKKVIPVLHDGSPSVFQCPPHLRCRLRRG